MLPVFQCTDIDTVMTQILLYIHGLPGSEQEIEAFDTNHVSEIVHAKPFGMNYNENILNNKACFKIISFSLGSMAAVELALEYPEKVDSLVLVSPAAPLELGDFLNDMDGRFIFKAASEAARGNTAIFSLLTYGQGLMARFSPNYLMKRMFGESCEAERRLLQNKQFTKAFQHGLRQSLHHESTEYMKTIMRFTKPWADKLAKVECPVEVWHGNSDTWAPISMGKALVKAVGTNASLIECDQLGHYSTLHYALTHGFEK